MLVFCRFGNFYELRRPVNAAPVHDVQHQAVKVDDPKNASANVGRWFRRLHAHGLIAKIPRTRRWKVTDYGRKVMGTHHVPA